MSSPIKAAIRNWVTPGVAASLLLSLVSHTALAADNGQKKIVANGETIRIQNFPGTISSGMPVLWVAIEKGLCAEHNIKCVAVDLVSGPLGLQALTAGSIEFSEASTDIDMQAAARGNDIQLVAATYPGLTFTLMAHKNVPLPNKPKGYPEIMHDLRGKKIGVSARGSSVEIWTRALLKGAGMQPTDVTFVAVGAPSTAYQAMLAGQIDAAMSWAPFKAVCEAQHVCQTVLDLGKGEGPREIQSLSGAFAVYAARRNFIESNPVVVDAFIQSLDDAVAWIKEANNFEEFMQISRKYVTLGDIPNGDAILRNLMKEQIQGMATSIDRRAVDANAAFLLNSGILDKPFDTTNFVYKNAPQPK